MAHNATACWYSVYKGDLAINSQALKMVSLVMYKY